MVYSTTGVTFDGINDFMERGDDFTGSTDSKIWSGSFWFKRNSIGTDQYIYRSTSDAARISFTVANLIQIRAENSIGTKVLDIRSSAITDMASWHHCCFSFDLAAANGELWIDDVSDYNQNTWIVDETIDFTVNNHGIGARVSDGLKKLDACLADWWNEQGVDLAFGTEANRRKFIDASGNVVDLGANGETPTSSSPIMFFKGGGSSFNTNLGTGGNFTVTGALTDCASNPPSAAAANPEILSAEQDHEASTTSLVQHLIVLSSEQDHEASTALISVNIAILSAEQRHQSSNLSFDTIFNFRNTPTNRTMNVLVNARTYKVKKYPRVYAVNRFQA